MRVGRAAVDMLACGLRRLFRRLLALTPATPASPRGGLFDMSRPPTADRVELRSTQKIKKQTSERGSEQAIDGANNDPTTKCIGRTE